MRLKQSTSYLISKGESIHTMYSFPPFFIDDGLMMDNYKED